MNSVDRDSKMSERLLTETRRTRRIYTRFIQLCAVAFFCGVAAYRTAVTFNTNGDLLKFNALILETVRENPKTEFKPLLTDDIKDEWKRELFGRLDEIRKKAGALCSINDFESFKAHLVSNPDAPVPPEGGIDVNATLEDIDFPPHLEAPVDCDSLFELDQIDAGDTSVPEKPPEELMQFYTVGGLVPFGLMKILKNIYMGSNAMTNVWTEAEIEQQMNLTLRGLNKGTYSQRSTNALFKLAREDLNLTGASVLVIGSERPWVEVIAILAGAANVTTLEYGAIESHHPKIRTMTPSVFRAAYQKGDLSSDSFDAVISYSSLEHSGLGRYGDALNPWGDILSLARAWCVTKNGGSLVVDVPGGSDRVVWNRHRTYGRYRWPLLTINWAPVGKYAWNQRRNIYTRIFKKLPSQKWHKK